MKMRTEKDSLGEKQVPAEAYFGIQTQRAVENYPISGYHAHPHLIRAMGMIKKAAALANRELKLLDNKRAAAIIQASEEVIAGKFDDQFVVDVYQAGAGVSFHMNTNEVIANRAIEILGGRRGDYEVCHPNDHVNFGQSTNDVFPTAMRLAAVILLDDVLHSLGELERSFARKGKAFDHILKSGRTHMMDAVPIRLGQEFSSYATAMRRAADVLRQAQEGLRELGLGGSAVGTGVNTHPKYQKLAVQAGQLELNVMMPTMAWNVLHAAEILKNTMRVLAEKCVDGITANEARCRYYANATVAIAAALNPYIGYAAAAEIAKESVKTGRTVTEIALGRKLLDEKLLREILDPYRMTEPAPPIEDVRKRVRNAAS